MTIRRTVDLTSAHYLGLWLGRDRLPDWGNLTTGVPAVLDPGTRADRVTNAIRHLIGGAFAATLSPSTLHAFWDVLSVLAADAAVICIDAAAYPIARWAAGGVAVGQPPGQGRRLRRFHHHSPAALRSALDETGGHGPVVVLTDGLCTGCGAVAPIEEYQEVLRRRGGAVVIDDTQALGVLGTPAPGHPYGVGGGGVLRYLRLTGGAGTPPVVLVASLAKGLGTPIAVIAASSGIIRAVETSGKTRVHCSPPSNAHLAAADVALQINARRGDGLRSLLASRVQRLRNGLVRLGVEPTPGLFPVQSVRAVPSGLAMPALWQRLRRAGVLSVQLGEQCDHRPAVAFLITAAHTTADIDRVLAALADCVRPAHRDRPAVSGKRFASDHRQPLPRR